MKPAPSARKYWRKVRFHFRRAVTSAPPRRSASPATAPSTSASSNGDMPLPFARAPTADAEQLQVVRADAGAEVGALERAPPDVLDVPAGLPHEVVVMAPELLGQLVPLRTVAELHPAGEPQPVEEVHGAVDGGEVDAPAARPLGDAIVDLFHLEGGGRGDEDIQYHRPRPG